MFVYMFMTPGIRAVKKQHKTKHGCCVVALNMLARTPSILSERPTVTAAIVIIQFIC